MSQRTISIIVLTVLTALPVSGTLCALLCASAKATAAAHHGSGANCEEPSPTSTGTLIQDVSQHDCGTHDASVRRPASTAAERADSVAGSVPLTVPTLHAVITTLIPVDSPLDYHAPPGAAPPAAAPLVLRV